MFTLHLEANTYRELIEKMDAILEESDTFTGALPEIEVEEDKIQGIHTLPEIFKPVGHSPVVPGIEVDSKGVLWDKLIHSANKFKNKDGTWRRRKGLDKKIEVGQPVVITPPTEEVTQVVPPPIIPVVKPPDITAPPLPVETPQVKSGHTLESFKSNLISIISDLLSTGKITKDYVTALNTHFGVDQMWDIIADDAKVEQLFNHFVAEGYVEKAG
jgi:hypothetical protein